MKKVNLLFAVLLAALVARAEDEFAMSFSFRLEEPVKANVPVAYGVTCEASPFPGYSPFHFSATSVPGVMKPRTYATHVEQEATPGVWHHVAFRYSVTNRLAQFWFDGKSQQGWEIGDGETLDTKALLKLAPGEKFKGTLTGFKTWKEKLPPLEEMLSGEIPEGEVAAAKSAFEKAATATGVNADFAAWCRAKAKEVEKVGAGKDLGAWYRLQVLRHRLPRLIPLAATKVTGPAMPFAIDRFSPRKHLPYAVPPDAKPFTELFLGAALGEWDCASFMVSPLADVKGFFLEPTELKGPDGATIPASDVDIRLVKCWYQCGYAWNTYFPAGRNQPMLCPEMLLHDDDFMRVDTDLRRNLLRVRYPEGDEFVDASRPMHENSAVYFNPNTEPVLDAKTFQKMDLTEGKLQQFWITVKANVAQKPGDYKGEIRMTAGGKTLGTLPFAVKVHPFELPWPNTHYNIDKPMLHGYYAHIGVRGKLEGEKNIHNGQGSYDWDRAVLRTDSEIRNMVEHGFGNVCVTTYSSPTNEWDYSDADATFLKRNGARLYPLFGDVGLACEFAIWNIWPPHGMTNLSVEANYEFWRNEMVAYTNRLKQVMPKIKEVYGHTCVKCDGFDEAGPATVRREMPSMATAQHFGGFSYTSQGRAEHAAFITDYDGCPQDINRESSHIWHASGSILTTYARPHGGPENPDLWRRRKGLFLWFADFDGQFEYIWYEGGDMWNEFIYGAAGDYKDFNMVQPVYDGVIDSVQWEGCREGIDDMRYATLLKLCCRAARATGDAKLVKAGREIDVWLELSDYKAGDLEELRLKMAQRIGVLQKALKAKGVDIAKLAPEQPKRQDLPMPKPYKATGDVYARRRMLDYAVRAWLAEGSEAGLFKAYDALLQLRRVKEADELLKKVENDANASSNAKAKARIRRGFINLTRTRFVWKPTREAINTARKALDYAVRHDVRRIGAAELAVSSWKLMGAARAIGDYQAAVDIGEQLATGPLKNQLGGRGAVVGSSEVSLAIGESYFSMKRYKRALEWFAGPAKGNRDYAALVRYGDTAKAMGDYVTAMGAYQDAANTIDRTQFESQYQKMKGLVAEMSAAIRKHGKQKPSESMIRNSDSDDAIDSISLDDD